VVKNCFKKPFRISKQKDIVFLLESGMRWKCDIFAVIYHQNSLEHDRLGVLVGKKNGGAVERVRIKRIYRELFQTTEVAEGVHYDIVIRPYYNRVHSFKKAKPLYEQWRCINLQKNSL